jgi:IclR family mhp operon transcriptional activator
LTPLQNPGFRIAENEGTVVRMPRDSVQSATRALALIEALNRRPVTPLETLHHETRLPKSTLVRLLETLIAAGYVARVSRREGYALTEGVLRLSAGVRQRDVLVDAARPLMEAFTREHKWQVTLATREGDVMLVRCTTRDISPFAREPIFLNRQVPMLRSAMGRAYIAACSDAEREVILKLLAAHDPAEIEAAGGPAAIAKVVERVRASGYATIVWPSGDPWRSFSLPILDRRAGGQPLGSIVIFYYGSVMSEAEAVAKYLAPMRELAGTIAAGLEAA